MPHTDPEVDADRDSEYECLECGEVVVAARQPVECPECGSSLRNRGTPLE